MRALAATVLVPTSREMVKTGFPPEVAWAFIGGSVAIYCPEHQALIDGLGR